GLGLLIEVAKTFLFRGVVPHVVEIEAGVQCFRALSEHVWSLRRNAHGRRRRGARKVDSSTIYVNGSHAQHPIGRQNERLRGIEGGQRTAIPRGLPRSCAGLPESDLALDLVSLDPQA